MKEYCRAKKGGIDEAVCGCVALQLESLEELQKVTSVAQRKEFGKELAEAEEWLYTDGEEATTAEFRKKLVGLKKFGDKMIGRMEEVTKRPLAVREGRKVVEEGRVTMEEWTTSKPWLNEMHKAEVEKELSLFSAWLDEKEMEQKRYKKLFLPTCLDASPFIDATHFFLTEIRNYYGGRRPPFTAQHTSTPSLPSFPPFQEASDGGARVYVCPRDEPEQQD